MAYELCVKMKWEGSVDYEEVSGTLELPYVSEDCRESGYEAKVLPKENERDDESHKKAARYLQKQLPEVKRRMQTFTDEIYAK